MSERGIDAELVKRDSQTLARGMETVLNRNNQEQAAIALFNEFQQIAGRGHEHTRRVFDNVRNDLGSTNFFSPNARLNREALCLHPGYMRSVAEALVFPDFRSVCASNDGTIVANDGQASRILPGAQRRQKASP